MLLLDIDRLSEDTEEFINMATAIVKKVDVRNLLGNLEVISREIEKAQSIFVGADDLRKSNVIIAEIIQLVQFWLISREQFQIIDKIIDRSENLPMKFIGD